MQIFHGSHTTSPSCPRQLGDCFFSKTTEACDLKQLRRANVPQDQLLHFYTGVIRPVLEYAAPVWNHLLTKTQIDQLKPIQRRTLRIIYSYTNNMPYINALYCAAIRSLADRREQLSCQFFKISPRTLILPF